MSSFTCNFLIYASPGTNQVLARDQAAAKALDPLPLLSESTTSEGPASNPEDAGLKATFDVYIGSPPNKHTLLIDRKSAHTWVGANKPFIPTSTSKTSGIATKFTHGSALIVGTEYTDQVAINEDLVFSDFPLDVASSVLGFGFKDIHGVVSVGPMASRSIPSGVPAFAMYALNQAGIIGFSFKPISDSSNTVAILTGDVGKTDPTKYTGQINYFPVTKASSHWSFPLDVTYGTDTPTAQGKTGILEILSALNLLEPDSFKVYQQATGATLDEKTGLLTITEEQLGNLQSLFFKIASETYELTPNAQIWPPQSNNIIGGEAGKIYLTTASMDNKLPSGVDVILGFSFLRHFYGVYDVSGKFGLAYTPSTQT